MLAARLAAGTLLAAGLIGWRHAVPGGFVRFVLGSAAGLFALAALLGGSRPDGPYWVGLLVVTAAMLFAGRRFGASPRLLAGAASVLGLAGALGSSVPGFVSGAPLAVAANLSAVGLLGATTAVMVLGHWYLVDIRLSIRPLAFGASLFLGATGIRVVVTALALLADGAAALRLSAPSDLIYSTTALFFSFRAITGLAAPAALSLLVRSTVRIRSTQSATGLLYVALILVLFGELTAAFLETITDGALA